MHVQPERASQIPAGIWALGFVSMLADISSELIHSLLPVFTVSVLGASAFAIGVLEGTAEATALIVKVFSGTLSDCHGFEVRVEHVNRAGPEIGREQEYSF